MEIKSFVFKYLTGFTVELVRCRGEMGGELVINSYNMWGDPGRGGLWDVIVLVNYAFRDAGVTVKRESEFRRDQQVLYRTGR